MSYRKVDTTSASNNDALIWVKFYKMLLVIIPITIFLLYVMYKNPSHLSPEKISDAFFKIIAYIF